MSKKHIITVSIALLAASCYETLSGIHNAHKILQPSSHLQSTSSNVAAAMHHGSHRVLANENSPSTIPHDFQEEGHQEPPQLDNKTLPAGNLPSSITNTSINNLPTSSMPSTSPNTNTGHQQEDDKYPRLLPLNENSTIASDIVSIWHETESKVICVELQPDARCPHPYLIGRLSGPHVHPWCDKSASNCHRSFNVTICKLNKFHLRPIPLNDFLGTCPTR